MYTIQPVENNDGRLGTKPNAHNQEQRVNGEERMFSFEQAEEDTFSSLARSSNTLSRDW